MVEPRHVHLVVAKHVLRYLYGTIGYSSYVSDGKVKLQGYTDFEWVGSVVDMKSTSEYCFSLGSGMISWLSRKQTSVALSATKEEYIAASDANREAVWLLEILVELFD